MFLWTWTAFSVQSVYLTSFRQIFYYLLGLLMLAYVSLKHIKDTSLKGCSSDSSLEGSVYT